MSAIKIVLDSDVASGPSMVAKRDRMSKLYRVHEFAKQQIVSRLRMDPETFDKVADFIDKILACYKA